jgi:hypothetical protein
MAIAKVFELLRQDSPCALIGGKCGEWTASRATSHRNQSLDLRMPLLEVGQGCQTAFLTVHLLFQITPMV